MTYHAGQFLTRDRASDRPEVRVEAVEGDRLTISAVDYPLAPWWSVPRGRLLGEWREVEPPPVMIDNYEAERGNPREHWPPFVLNAEQAAAVRAIVAKRAPLREQPLPIEQETQDR